MRRCFLKTQDSKASSKDFKLVSFEDGYFPPHLKGAKGSYTVLASLHTHHIHPKDINLSLIEIDGLDGTEKALSMLTLFKMKNLDFNLILLGGITYAGFNIIDPIVLNENFNVPVIVITQDRPNDVEVEKALKKHFIDWKERLAILKKFRSKARIFKFARNKTKLYIQPLGLSREEAENIVESLVIRGGYPEPLKLAKQIASALGKLIFL